MPITTDTNTINSSTSAVTSRSWSHTVGTAFGGRLMIVTVAFGDTALPTNVSVTYGGVALTLGVTVSSATYNLLASIYYLVNPPTGSNSISVSWTNATTCAFSGMSLYGVSRNNPIYTGSATTQAATTGNPSLSVPAMNGGRAIDCISLALTDESLTVGASQTAVQNMRHGASSYESYASGSTIAMTWTKAVGRRHVGAGLSLVPGSSMVSPAVSPFMRF